jgi:hypothetical protein
MSKYIFHSVPESDESEAEILNDSVINESLAHPASLNQSSSSSQSNGLSKKDQIGRNFDWKRPRTVKDFTVLANLVELASHCIPKCNREW